MTFAKKETLDNVELVKAVHSFGVLETAAGPLAVTDAKLMDPAYTLFEAQFPYATEPVDADDIRLLAVAPAASKVIEENSDTDPQPLITIMLSQEMPDDQASQAEGTLLVGDTGAEENPFLENPSYAGLVVLQAIAKEGLESVWIAADNVVGIDTRYEKAAHYLLEAGFRSDSQDRLKLAIGSKSPVPVIYPVATPDQATAESLEPIAA